MEKSYFKIDYCNHILKVGKAWELNTNDTITEIRRSYTTNHPPFGIDVEFSINESMSMDTIKSFEVFHIVANNIALVKFGFDEKENKYYRYFRFGEYGMCAIYVTFDKEFKEISDIKLAFWEDMDNYYNDDEPTSQYGKECIVSLKPYYMDRVNTNETHYELLWTVTESGFSSPLESKKGVGSMEFGTLYDAALAFCEELSTTTKEMVKNMIPYPSEKELRTNAISLQLIQVEGEDVKVIKTSDDYWVEG